MKLSKKRTADLLAQMRAAALGGGDAWNKWIADEGYKTATLSMASGELFNPEIEGFVWAWKMTDKISTNHKIPPNAGLVAQGLEGLVKVQTDLTVALLVIDEVSTERAFIEI